MTVAVIAALLALVTALPARAGDQAPQEASGQEAPGAEPVEGGATLDDAPVLGPGLYADGIALGERRFYAIEVPAGLAPASALAVGGLEGAAPVDGVLHLGIIDGGGRLVEEAYVTEPFAGDEERQLQARATQGPQTQEPETFYVGIALERAEDDGAAPDGAAPDGAGDERYPLRLALGTVEAAAGEELDGALETPQPTPQAGAPAPGAPRDGERAVGAGDITVVSALAFVIGAVVGFVRMRIMRSPLASSPLRDRTRRLWVRMTSVSGSV